MEWKFFITHWHAKGFWDIRNKLRLHLYAEKAMAPHSSTLAWKIPWTEEPGRLQSMGSLRVGTTERLHFHFSLSCFGEGNGTHFSILAWRIPGTGEPSGLLSMGSHRVGYDWSNLAAAATFMTLRRSIEHSWKRKIGCYQKQASSGESLMCQIPHSSCGAINLVGPTELGGLKSMVWLC